MPTAAGPSLNRTAALINRCYAKLGVTLGTTTRVALEGRDARPISINFHSFHAPML
jgi:hypothetical protein